MTELLRSWTMTLAGIIVFGSLCEMILPNGVYKKYIHLAIGLMLCLAVLSPVASKKITADASFLEVDVYAKLDIPKKTQKGEILRLYKDKLCKNIVEELKKTTDLNLKVNCDVYEDEDNFGTIKYIWITVDINDDERISDKAIESIKNMYGINDDSISIKYLK